MTSEDIKKFLSENGKKGGAVNKAKGADYFKWVVSHRGNVKSKKAKCEKCGKLVEKRGDYIVCTGCDSVMELCTCE